MAFLTFNFESRYLNGNTEIGMILPECSRRMEAAEFYRPGKKYRVLWLEGEENILTGYEKV